MQVCDLRICDVSQRECDCRRVPVKLLDSLFLCSLLRHHFFLISDIANYQHAAVKQKRLWEKFSSWLKTLSHNCMAVKLKCVVFMCGLFFFSSRLPFEQDVDHGNTLQLGDCDGTMTFMALWSLPQLPTNTQ